MLLNESERILAGKIVNQELDFTFEVWAYQKVAEEDLRAAYRAFLARNESNDKRKSLRGTVIRHLTNHGLVVDMTAVAKGWDGRETA